MQLFVAFPSLRDKLGHALLDRSYIICSFSCDILLYIQIMTSAIFKQHEQRIKNNQRHMQDPPSEKTVLVTLVNGLKPLTNAKVNCISDVMGILATSLKTKQITSKFSKSSKISDTYQRKILKSLKQFFERKQLYIKQQQQNVL